MAKDKHWRYVITAATFTTFLCNSSMLYSNGTVFMALRESRRYELDTLAWLFSVSDMLHAFGGPCGSVLTNATSCRTSLVISGVTTLLGFLLSSLFTDIRVLFFTYGILLGLGRGMCFTTSVISIGYWYRDSSAVATGVGLSGVGAGMFIHPRLLQAFIDFYGLSGGLQMMGAISFHACICGLLLRPSRYERQRTKMRQPSTNPAKVLKTFFINIYRHILKNVSFVSFLIGFSFFHMGFQAIITFLPDYYKGHGSTPQDAALAASVLGGGGLISRILVGIAAQEARIGTVLLFSGCCGLAAMITAFIPLFVATRIGKFIYAFGVGIYISSMYVLGGPTSLNKVGVDNFAYAFGFLMMNTGFVSLIGPPIAVQFQKLSGSYSAVFIFAACSLLLASVLGLLSELPKKVNDSVQDKTTEKLMKERTITIAAPEDELQEENILTTEKQSV